MAFLSGTTLLGTRGRRRRPRPGVRVHPDRYPGHPAAHHLAVQLRGRPGRPAPARSGSPSPPPACCCSPPACSASSPGVGALRQMDDKPGVPLLATCPRCGASVRGRGPPRSPAETAAARVGRFIVFEGGEGAGKSTQVRPARRARSRLRPGGGGHPRAGRDRGRRAHPRAACWTSPAERRAAVAAGRGAALRRRPGAPRGHRDPAGARTAGAMVISDRYVDSSLAYQGAGRTLPVEEVRWLSRWATGGLQPGPGGAARHRPGRRAHRVADRERRGPAGGRVARFHQRVRHAFLDLAAAEPGAIPGGGRDARRSK